MGFWVCFLLLRVKIKALQKISRLRCWHCTLACFHDLVKPIWYILYQFQKHCVVKAIRYEISAELFILNGNKRSIRYEFHNSIEPNRHWKHGNRYQNKDHNAGDFNKLNVHFTRQWHVITLKTTFCCMWKLMP